MYLGDHKKSFYENVLPSRPNEWEVDEVFERLSVLDEGQREALLAHVGAIWPVSHSLCFAYLTDGVDALALFSIELLPQWVRQILDLYEKKGLLGAREFMADVDRSFLGPMRGEAGVTLDEISPMMVHYVRGISGRSFELDVAPIPFTDTKTIYLPKLINTFSEKDKNTLLYKLLVTLQWTHVDSGIFHRALGANNMAPDLFSGYPDEQLANDLFGAIQFAKMFKKLEGELPGLIRQGREICIEMLHELKPGEATGTRKCNAIGSFLRGVIMPGGGQNDYSALFRAALKSGGCNLQQCNDTDVLSAIYPTISKLTGTYTLGSMELLLGKFNFSQAGETVRLKREDDKSRFVSILATAIENKTSRLDEESEGGNIPSDFQDTLLLVLNEPPVEKGGKQKRNEFIIENSGFDLSEELKALISEIKIDLGTVPDGYVQAAVGLAGGGVNRQQGDISEKVPAFSPTAPYTYDEWDYRRGGYRADWCSLYEKTLNPVRSGFVAATLAKYRPQVIKLRRQFEMLRTRERFVRRRRHGDEIDLDALIEALGDSRAGLTPSDRLFIRLLRDERDITTLFLVDMSNSTEGWVGVAVKEALVLLAEALEVVGDQYGIYGFSGMRRSKNELYHVKHPEEPYGQEVQRRIGAIAPKEYTRMGPPIRHLTKQLLEIPSKVRLLIVISDGKPEDYDDYKGQYAIEDTRKALLEARGQGLYPFCITIDKSAHEYLAHMFGRGNYIFVDNVSSLPAKMAEMYRLLTS